MHTENMLSRSGCTCHWARDIWVMLLLLLLRILKPWSQPQQPTCNLHTAQAPKEARAMRMGKAQRRLSSNSTQYHTCIILRPRLLPSDLFLPSGGQRAPARPGGTHGISPGAGRDPSRTRTGGARGGGRAAATGRGRLRCPCRPARPCRDHGTADAGAEGRAGRARYRRRSQVYPHLVHKSLRSPLRGADGEGRGDGAATDPRVGGERAGASSPPRPRGPALPSGPPHPAPGASLSPQNWLIALRGLSTCLGVELSPFQRCPLAAKPSSAVSGARPLGAPAPRSPAPHRLSAEAPRRPLACGAGRRGRETPLPPPGAARPPAAEGAAAVAKGAVSGSAESGGRAGPGQHGDVAAHKRPGESGREVRTAARPGQGLGPAGKHPQLGPRLARSPHDTPPGEGSRLPRRLGAPRSLRERRAGAG